MKTNDAFNPSNPVNIEFLEFTTNDGNKYDLKNFFIEFDIYTSIANIMEARVLLIDANDIVSKFPIMGGEKIRFRFSTSGRKDKTTLDFRVGSIGERIQTDKMKSLWLELVTEDRYMDVKRRASRGFNTVYTEMVQKIISEAGLTRPLNSEQSVGISSVATPRWSPLNVCKWIATRAIDGNNMPFAFFEDFKGYNFISLTTMIKGEVEDQFFLQEAGFNEEDYKKFRNIQDIWVESKYDSVGFNSTGLNKAKHVQFDFNTKNIVKEDRSYKQHFDKMPSMEQFPYKVEEGPEYETEIIEYTRPDNSHLGQYNRKLLKYLFQQYALNITVYGDNEIKLGGIYKFNVPEVGPIVDGVRHNEKYTSGKFLAAAIKHVIRPDDYKMNIRLIKDSLSDQLAEASEV
ncbi:hypothetical protein [Vibrio phage VP-1]|uniref:Uncharacterized protein n=1 Tax=Vibrio phage VP-1 TaxID=2234088 RepID=A0A4P2TFR7_9CAUD|nr:hypothetical protein [Vibrio phage VP-1]